MENNTCPAQRPLGHSDLLARTMPDEPQLELLGKALGDLVELSPGQTRQQRIQVLLHPGGTTN